jgi:hypothetical protein
MKHIFTLLFIPGSIHAAYAMGQIKLYIPFKEVDGCLTEEFKKLVGSVSK